MLKISDPQEPQNIPALFQLGFRPFFLFGTLFSIISVLLWVMVISGFVMFYPYGGSLWWHGHEMIFGFVAAIIVGFLLTAVQNWTGIPSVKGLPLVSLFSIWFAARVMLAINYDSLFTAIIDVIFLPLAALYLAIPIIKIKQYRNLIFIPALLLLTITNIMTHLNVHYPDYNGFQSGVYGAVIIIMLLMTIIGGRVIPFFTANSTGMLKVEAIRWLEFVAIGTGFILALIFIFGVNKYTNLQPYVAALCYLVGITHTARWYRWRFWTTLKIPLLWSLHVSYLMIPISCFLFGLHFSHGSVSIQSVLHLLTIGAIGMMIIAMISRVSLGHTGRQLKPHWLMTYAFIAIICAAIVRFSGSVFLHDYLPEALLITGLLWALGYGLFFMIYFNILTSPRVDGRPG